MSATREQIRQAALEADLDQQMAKMQERRRERQIAADREHRDRRERIATAALAGLLAHYGENSRYDNTESREVVAVAYADALIRELDKKEGGT